MVLKPMQAMNKKKKKLTLQPGPSPMAAKPDSVSCMSLTGAASRVYHFKVECYSIAKQIASIGECFQSDVFTVGGYDWAVRYYPKRLSGDSYVSLNLVLLSKVKGGGAGVRFVSTLLDKSGKPSTGLEQCLSAVFSFQGQEKGFFGFMEREDLETNFLTGDCLVVQCNISVLKRPIEK